MSQPAPFVARRANVRRPVATSGKATRISTPKREANRPAVNQAEASTGVGDSDTGRVLDFIRAWSFAKKATRPKQIVTSLKIRNPKLEIRNVTIHVENRQ